MALNAPRTWLLCYDIADPRRLGQVHRFIKRHALMIQFSVYYYEGSTIELQRLLRDTGTLIDPKADDVRAYPIPADAEIVTLGAGSMTGHIQLLSDHQQSLPALLRPSRRSDKMPA